MKKAIFWFCVLILGLSTITFFPVKTYAAMLNVDGADPSCSDVTGDPYCTIQQAIDDASDGDTIAVAADVYDESLLLPGVSTGINSLTLIGAGADTTIISPTTGTAISSFDTLDNFILEGFTLTSADDNGFECINFLGANHGTIFNNIFTDNTTALSAGISFFGGCGFDIHNNTFSNNLDGIDILSSSETNNIYDNTFTNNDYAAIYFGGADSTNNSIYGNTFTGNAFAVHLDASAASVIGNDMHNNGNINTDEPGVAVSAETGSTIQIYGNKIYQNQSPITGAGIAETGSTAGSNIFNNYIAQNDAAAGVGGGIYSLADSTPIYNNTIVNNTAFGGAPTGIEGMQSHSHGSKSDNPTVQEKINELNSRTAGSWDNAHINTGAGTKGGGVWVLHDTAPAPAFYNNIVWGNTDDITDMDGDLVVNYTDVEEPWIGTGTGNKSSDPLLAGYVLGEGSPCIDTGTSNGAPSNDIDGTSRPQRNGYDIGAYELPGPPTLPETGGNDHNQNLVLILISVLSVALIFIGTKKLIFSK
jgi:parallel beta-helix repeat protein